ncbi:MAG: recombinase family protein, partial [Ruminococcus sp.]
MKKFISWRRVSTMKQGASGLGLQAQTEIIEHFVKSEKGELIADYHEVYTGKELSGCVELRKAMQHCKESGATLIIAKTDRFRNTIEALQIYDEMEGNIYFCDLPHTDKFTLTLFFALAEREALIVSIRTKAALAAKKAQGYKLGNGKGVDLSKANEASARARTEKARCNPNNKIIWGVIGQNGTPTAEDVQRMSLQLNQMGVNTSTGLEFTPERVRTTFHNLKRIF